MPDILIRNIPAEDLARLDEQAERLGLSRADFLRRQLHEQAGVSVRRVSADDLQGLADALADLNDPDVIAQAWS